MSTHETGVDLRHLRIFLELYLRRSVSRTAEALDMTQSGVSIALARMRVHFNDPLFVRSGQTMQPTTRATLMVQPITDAMQLIDQATTDVPEFVPAKSTRLFHIALPDVGKVVVLPIIACFLREHAPTVKIEVHGISSTTPEELEAGSLDLAFGFMELRKSGLFSQTLFKDKFACIVRCGHPLVKGRITLAQFKSIPHVMVGSSGNSATLAQRAIVGAGVKINPSIVLETYHGVAEVVSGSDLIAVMSHRLATTLAKHYAVDVLPVPAKMPAYDVKQHWHRRSHNDPGHQWLRQSIYNLFHSA
ncbi:MAG: LysR family transcriptional regulator [Pseudomonadota bacterium]